jgi:hypothetical protein
MKALALIIALAACAAPSEPAPLPPPPEPLNPEVEAPAGAQEAAEAIKASLETDLGLELPELPAVRWFERGSESSLLYPQGSVGATSATGGCRAAGGTELVTAVLGCFWTREGGIVHLLRYSDDPARSSLEHELVHWALWLATGDTDGEHTGEIWSTRGLR